ncbi:hypothetical protein ACTG2M_17105 [Aeromonas veronii]|uniref:hypothetical protein n=1 Tax=Aeromonas veronii TaxID=654 RepID=UPI003F78F000
MYQEALEQLKWIYSGLAGICLAVILATLTLDGEIIGKSYSLILSISLFTILFVKYTCFTIVHVTISEAKINFALINEELSKKWVRMLTYVSFYLLYFAFFFLLCHISILFGMVYALSSLILFPLTKYFLGKIGISIGI